MIRVIEATEWVSQGRLLIASLSHRAPSLAQRLPSTNSLGFPPANSWRPLGKAAPPPEPHGPEHSPANNARGRHGAGVCRGPAGQFWEAKAALLHSAGPAPPAVSPAPAVPAPRVTGSFPWLLVWPETVQRPGKCHHCPVGPALASAAG